ncbi:hypothetical protein ACWGS9_33435 [Bradyrhizobium sp. Arg314]
MDAKSGPDSVMFFWWLIKAATDTIHVGFALPTRRWRLRHDWVTSIVLFAMPEHLYSYAARCRVDL